MLAAQGKGGGGSAALAGASVDVCGGDGTGRGGEAALALLCLRQGWAANASACPACLRPRAEVRGGQRLLPAAVLASQLCNL
jgi:hypothetical protein